MLGNNFPQNLRFKVSWKVSEKSGVAKMEQVVKERQIRLQKPLVLNSSESNACGWHQSIELIILQD